MNALALHLARQRAAEASVHRASDGFVTVQQERYIEHIECGHDGRPHRRGVQAHVEAARHDGIVHALVGVELTGRVRRDLNATIRTFIDALCKALHALR